MKNFTNDDLAWADFLSSKAALILSSIVLFAALFHLVSVFKDFEAQQQLDSLALDFKNSVDKAGAVNFQAEVPKDFSAESAAESSKEFKQITYCFNEKAGLQSLNSVKNLKVRVSGEYVSLEAESDGRNIRAVRPFAFRTLPVSKPVLQEKLYKRFGADGSETSPVTADFEEFEAFIRVLGTEETILVPEENISLKKELIFIKKDEEVSDFACILIYQ